MEGPSIKPRLEISRVSQLSGQLVVELGKVIRGKEQALRECVVTLLSNGHLLIEDIPGVGKTTLAKALARLVGADFKRVQFTPDLLPADVIGSAVFNQREHSFEFRPGPIFADILLVDEINRATPKTQSALLEAMEERQVTIEGVTRHLPPTFMVLATQNNIETAGTYALPEAQLDRFFSRLSLGYPDRATETTILRDQQLSHPLEHLGQITDLHELGLAQEAVRALHVGDALREYIVEIVSATRQRSAFAMGASPRGSLYLMHAAQAHAAMDGFEFVRPDDVKAVAPLVLSHRVIARGETGHRGESIERVIDSLVEELPVPVPAR